MLMAMNQYFALSRAGNDGTAPSAACCQSGCMMKVPTTKDSALPGPPFCLPAPPFPLPTPPSPTPFH